MSSRASPQKIQKLFVEAATRLQQGDAAGARRGLEKVAKLAPDSAAVWYNLALSGQHLGLHGKAVREYEKSLRLAPDNVDARVSLGLSQLHLGNRDAALESAREAIARAPQHARALNLMGSLLAEANDVSAAMEYFRRALASDPGNVDARVNLARAQYERGDSAAALTTLEPVAGRADVTLEHALLFGEILVSRRDAERAARYLEDIRPRFGDSTEFQMLEISLYERTNENFTVVELAERFVQAHPKHAAAWNSLGRAYFQLGMVEEGMAGYRKAMELDPERAEYHNYYGLACASMGDRETAEDQYQQALALDPDFAEAWRNLIAMRKFSAPEGVEVDNLKRLLREKSDDDTLSRVNFALGKVYDDCGLYDEGFAHYARGNALKAKEVTMDFDAYFAHIDRIAEVLDFDPEPLGPGEVDCGQPRPIFVLGMSRSGTTLVEQILARHPEVTGCGELPCVERIISRLEKRKDAPSVYPDDFPGLPSAEYAAEYADYYAWLAQLRRIETPAFTDKMPFNFLHIWLIRRMFARAVVVHCHRHPLDVILSNYFQLYGSDINFVYDLDILGRYYVRYHRLMRHWESLFPGWIFRIQYEELVADQEGQVRKMLEHAGLPWDDACLDHRRVEAGARTASIWQVRQKIYSSSKERWRHYEKHLAPAAKILQREGILDDQLRYLE